MIEAEQKQIFGNWLDQYRGVIFKVVRAYAFDPMDQDDLFQEIIIQVWRSVPTFRNESAVSTWLYRISLNTAIKWVKKERRQLNERLDTQDYVLQEQPVTLDERLTWLYNEISKLDKIDRSITLLMLDEFSYKEMAAITGMTESNVGVRLNRIKKYLIQKSKQYEHHGI